MKTLPIGTRVFNRGDMANIEHWATITKHIGGTKQSPAAYELTPDNDEPHDAYTYPARRICEVDSGNCSTRVVTEKAYDALHEEQASFLASWGMLREFQTCTG